MAFRRQRSLILIVGMALLAFGLSYFALPAHLAKGEVYYSSSSQVMQIMVAKTNQLRIEHRLSQLQPSRALESSAKSKLSNMSAANYWGHYGPDGLAFSTIIWQKDPNADIVGEDLARCYGSYDAAFDAWVDSPAHYKVLTGNYDSIGVASALQPNGCESIVLHVSGH